MINDLQYIVDENGTKTSVLVPIETWENLNREHEKIQRKLEILNGIKNGLSEVKATKQKGKSLQTLQDFLK